jgi:hypothetical protein
MQGKASYNSDEVTVSYMVNSALYVTIKHFQENLPSLNTDFKENIIFSYGALQKFM